MKHLYSIVFVLLTLSSSGFVQAQSIVANMASYPGFCDGNADFWDHANFSSGWTWTWYKDSDSISTGVTGLSNLCPGNYTLILDSSGVQLSESFTITDPCSYLTYTHSVTPSTLGNCDGAISTAPYIGSPPYTYAWSNGSTSQNLSNVCPGTYTVTCTDVLGCSATITATVSSSLISPNLTFDNGSPGQCNGYATVAPTGGSGTYFYDWSTGNNSTSTSNLCPGNYDVSIWDSNGSDTVTVSFTIVNPCTIIFAVYQVTPTVNGNCNGSVVTSIYGGTHPFSYSWSNGQTTVDLSNVCAGTYTLNCTDYLGCTLQQTVNVTDSISCNGFTGSLTSTPVSGPAICDGSLVFNPSGGTAPYTFVWSNGTTTQSISSGCPGSYTVTCTDAVGCSVTDTGSIIDTTTPPLPLSINLTTLDDLATNCTGSASVSPSGGTPPYTVYWNTEDTTYHIDSLCAGLYTVYVIDAVDTLITGFSIADSNTTYGNNPYPNATINDTLYLDLVSNCIIDYSAIDSASLYQAVYDPINQNLFVTWAVYSPTDTVYISDTLGWAAGPGYYALTISVYCPNKSGNDFFKIETVIYFDGTTVWFSTLGVNEQLLDHIAIYPNPFTNSISVDNKDGAVRSIKLSDLNGRMLSEMNAVNSGMIKLDQLETISSGTYLLILSGENSSKIVRMVK